MTLLLPLKNKLSKLIPLLASDKDGEVVATVRAISRTLTSAGADWHDVAAALGGLPARVRPEPPVKPPTSPKWDGLERSARLAWLDALLASDELTAWEIAITTELRKQTYCRPDILITRKQRSTLDGLIHAAFLRGVRP